MHLLGLDIGGANLKLATHDGGVLSIPFPLWERPNDLAAALRDAAETLCPHPDLVAVTMTGELADCFETKHEGVLFILDQVEAAFPETLIRIWMTSGEFAEPDDARDLTELVAAANWHALATWSARIVPRGPGLLVDVGSTTTDLIRLQDGMPANEGTTDLERLLAGELLYMGTSRTPVCAMTPTVALRGRQIPIAAEFFATLRDVYLITGAMPEDPTDVDTADRRAATRPNSLNRLAHMLCCDRTELSEEELQSVAQQIASRQLERLTQALQQLCRQACEETRQTAEAVPGLKDRQPAIKPTLILSGSGSFLSELAVEALGRQQFSEIFHLAAMYRCDVSAAACAFAVARLAAERCLDDLLPLTVL